MEEVVVVAGSVELEVLLLLSLSLLLLSWLSDDVTGKW